MTDRTRSPAPPPAAVATERPMLVVFGSRRCGRSPRVDGFLAQVLQRRRDHGTFALRHVDVDARPDLAERFAVAATPTLVVVERRRVVARLATPAGAAEIERFLEPWLR